MTIDYRYARGDLLRERQSYFYSAFHGQPFLTAWRASRHAALEWLSRHETASAPAASDRGEPPTLDRLRALQREVASGKLDTERRGILDKLVQRFEVSKRLHGDYDNAFKPLDPEDFTDVRLYVEFGELLAMAAGTCRQLSYLNALLKCTDILTALLESVPADYRLRLRRLLETEEAIVAALERKLMGRARC